MPRFRKTTDPRVTAAKLDVLATTLQHLAEGSEADPFDDAMLSAVFALIELSKTHTTMFADLEARTAKLARRG